MNAKNILQNLESHYPQAAQLAILSSIPVRVTPAMLRLARVKLEPRFHTGDEADVWLSDLVEAKSGAGFSFRPEVRELLRNRLVAQPEMLDGIWSEVLERVSPWLEPKIRLEHEQTWRFLKNPSDSKINDNWLGIWDEIQHGDNAKGVARWAVRAIADMPKGVLNNATAKKIWLAANLMIGNISMLGNEPQRFVHTREFAFAIDRLPKQLVYVGITEEEKILFSTVSFSNSHDVMVPQTRPFWLQIEDSNEQGLEVLTLTGSEQVLSKTSSKDCVLRLLDGSTHNITSEPESSHVQRSTSPKVQITYSYINNDQEIDRELPFVTTVLADLSGKENLAGLPRPMQRLIEVERFNFNEVMEHIQPQVSFTVDNYLPTNAQELSVDLVFRSMKDFEPSSIAQAVKELKNFNSDSFAFNKQLTAILQHPELRKIEGTWRGLHYLVSNSETSETQKIKVLDMSWAELLLEFEGQSIRKQSQENLESNLAQIFSSEFLSFNGEPVSCIIGDYSFDHSLESIAILRGMANLCADIQAPFFAGVAPSLFGASRWQNVAERLDSMGRIFGDSEYLDWNQFREKEESQYIGLMMPQYLSRSPYDAITGNGIREAFTEQVDDGNEDCFVWSNAAYLCGANINRSVSTYGWPSMIIGFESGGAQSNLSKHGFRSTSSSQRLTYEASTIMQITDRLEANLADAGLNCLILNRTTGESAIIVCQSLHQVQSSSTNPEEHLVQRLQGRFPHMLPVYRFVHYLRVMAQANNLADAGEEQMRRQLQDWLNWYITGDPDNEPESVLARHPLNYAELRLRPDSNNGVSYSASLDARPIFKSEYYGVSVTVNFNIGTRLLAETFA